MAEYLFLKLLSPNFIQIKSLYCFLHLHAKGQITKRLFVFSNPQNCFPDENQSFQVAKSS